MVKFVLLEKNCTFHIIKEIDDTKNGPNIQLLIPPDKILEKYVNKTRQPIT